MREAVDEAGLLVAHRLGLAALAARDVELAAQVAHALLLALELARLTGEPRLALVQRALAQHRRRVLDPRILEELVPVAEDVAHRVGVRPVLPRQPVLGARQVAGEHRPAEQREEHVRLLDVVHGLA